MSWINLPAGIRQRAQMVADVAENPAAADILRAWVDLEPLEAAQVMLALARMADRDKVLKSAHAAYARGERSDDVVEMEREYQRKRKAAEYRIRKHGRALRAVEGGGE